METITHLPRLSQRDLTQLQNWINHIKQYMMPSVSTYAPGREELHLRHFVKLAKAKDKGLEDEVTPIPDAITKKYKSEFVEQLGEKIAPGFNQALVLRYPTGSLIKPHRDSRAYSRGAASINIIGGAKFFISHEQDAGNMQGYDLGEGSQISFDNKQPHAVAKVKEERWCVCFFYLKKEYLPAQSVQLGLLDTPQPEVQTKQQDSKTVKQNLTTRDHPRIYTSWYGGQKIGEETSISLYPPKTFKGKHEPLFAPTCEILTQYKDRDPKKITAVQAIARYKRDFNAEMVNREALIDRWLEQFSQQTKSVTLLCYEADDPERLDNQFCHRHIVSELIKSKRPDIWGGEVSYCLYKFNEPEAPNFGFEPGQAVQVLVDDEWLNGEYMGTHATSFAKPGQFSFIEVKLQGRHKIRKVVNPNCVRAV